MIIALGVQLLIQLGDEPVQLAVRCRLFQLLRGRLGERAPVRLMNLRFGSASTSVFGNAVRSRIRQTMSNGASCFFASASGWSKTVTSTPCKAFQSAYFRATFW